MISIDKWIGFNLLQLEAMYIFKFINNNKGNHGGIKASSTPCGMNMDDFITTLLYHMETFIVLTIGIWLVTQINSHSGMPKPPFENLKSQVIPWKTIENLKAQVIPWLNNNSYIIIIIALLLFGFINKLFMHINPSKYLLSLARIAEPGFVVTQIMVF